MRIAKSSCYCSYNMYSFLSELEEQLARSHKIFWEDPQKVKGLSIEYEGIPFIFGSKCILDCKNGPDRHKKAKKKLAEQQVMATYHQ